MKRAFKVVKCVIRAILAVVCVLLLVYNAYVLIARYAFGVGMPTVFGYSGAAVVSGSMDDDSGDDIEIGDFVITKSQDNYAVGDVITFYEPSLGGYVTHRIISADESGFITKGDANNVQDGSTVAQDDIVGKVVAVLKGGGSAIEFMRSPLGLLAIVAAVVVIWVATDIISNLLSGKKDEKEQL